MGDFGDALASAQQAVSTLRFSSPRAYTIRALAYYKLDRIPEARVELARAKDAARSVDVRIAGDDSASDGFQPGSLLKEAEALLSLRR
jgi:hypothetical protein